MNDNSPDTLLLIGKVIRPHGLEGLLRIISYAESETVFLETGIIFLQSPSGEPHDYEVISVNPHKNGYLLRLKGLVSRDQAEALKGAAIFVPRRRLGTGEEDEYYWYDLIGLEVYLTSGRYLGRITYILPTGSNDIYVVRQGDKETLIPAIHDVVKEIDLSNRRMLIADMEGLLELNES